MGTKARRATLATKAKRVKQVTKGRGESVEIKVTVVSYDRAVNKANAACQVKMQTQKWLRDCWAIKSKSHSKNSSIMLYQ